VDKRKAFLFIELIALLALPLLNLNLLYIVLALILTFLTRHLTGETFSDYGFFRPTARAVFMAVAAGLILGLAANLLLDPLLVRLTGKEVDLGGYERVRGNLTGFVGLLALGWAVGGLFEEYFFRGYLFNRIRGFLRNRTVYRFSAIVLTSVVFAFAHAYQGITGILGTFIFSVIMGALFFYFRKNTWCLVLVHGCFDTVGITMLYLGRA
jgi:membrane protease YdiL (CAAX protease family)